ncbi:MAG: hypothetical protein V2A73_18970, partial [Pseudomonadota bacterium]
MTLAAEVDSLKHTKSSAVRGLDELAALVRDNTPRVVLHGCEGAFVSLVVARVAAELPRNSR